MTILRSAIYRRAFAFFSPRWLPRAKLLDKTVYFLLIYVLVDFFNFIGTFIFMLTITLQRALRLVSLFYLRYVRREEGFLRGKRAGCRINKL